MIAEAAAAIQGLRGAMDMDKGFQNLKNEAQIAEATIELTQKLLETQQSVLDLQEMAMELQGRLYELERLDIDRFELTELSHDGSTFPGRKAYRHRESGDFYSPTCFSIGKLTPMQFFANGLHPRNCGVCGQYLGTISS